MRCSAWGRVRPSAASALLAGLAPNVLLPGGLLLLGDGFWRNPPCPDYLAVLGADPSELTHAQNAERLRREGLTLLATAAASDDEWDDYEGRRLRAKVRWARAHPHDVDAPVIVESALAWYDAYLRWGRTTLGFGWYLAVV